MTKMIWKSLVVSLLFFYSCGGDDPIINEPDNNDGKDSVDQEVDFSALTDTYWDIREEEYSYDWGIHNVHDPVIRKFGDEYYCYSTDVGFGIDVRLGLQIRKSKNLIEWTFVGWVFDLLPSLGSAYIEQLGAVPNNGLWAPAVYVYEDEYRLYYSLASNVGLKSCIGLATSSSPRFGWKERDVVVGTDGKSTQTNGIDPSIIITPDGEHWMFYGSSWDGIYIVQLNPVDGLALKSGDRGKRIAHRGFTTGTMNGNIEAAEVIYNTELGMYYLFISYDWLETKYNTRVGRSENISGPYYDMFGNDLFENEDNYPMVVAPYKFNGHSGWQGVSHCTVFEEAGQYYIAHQGRPGENMYYMDLHVRELFWTEDGWPVASPERYAGHKQSELSSEDLTGAWEVIDFEYKVVPGFGNEQTTPDFQNSQSLILNENGTLNSSNSDTWSFEYPWMTLTIDGITTDVHVSVGRDWENIIDSTLVFTGLSSDGMPLWGKKL
jgi:arabinan endo-1,5-alpha-L-arabinosidase